MGAAEEKRNLKEVAQEDGKRERALAREPKVSDVPPGILGPHFKGKIRERATVGEAKVSDTPTQLMDLIGKRKRALAKGVKDSDILSQFLDSTRGGR